jgi:hypothetical protein
MTEGIKNRSRNSTEKGLTLVSRNFILKFHSFNVQKLRKLKWGYHSFITFFLTVVVLIMILFGVVVIFAQYDACQRFYWQIRGVRSFI